MHGRRRGQQVSCSSEVSVFDTSTGKCEQNVRELASFLSHTQRHLLCAFVGQVGILLIALTTRSVLQCASFMSGQGEKGVRTHNKIQKHHICFPPLVRYMKHGSSYPDIMLLSEYSKISSDCSLPVQWYWLTFLPSYVCFSCQNYVSFWAAAFFLDKVSFLSGNSTTRDTDY